MSSAPAAPPTKPLAPNLRTTVSELGAPIAISLAAVVQHVQILEASGLVRTEKIGRTRTCQIDTNTLAAAERWLEARRSQWNTHLDRLGDYLDRSIGDRHSSSLRLVLRDLVRGSNALILRGMPSGSLSIRPMELSDFAVRIAYFHDASDEHLARLGVDRALLPDPSLLIDMDVAAERLASAVSLSETVGIFGDYDVDGACSAALMVTWLRGLGRMPSGSQSGSNT